MREVAVTSGGTFKATSVAGYERGERSITVERFLLLCELYDTPAARVLDDIQRSYAGHPGSEAEIDLTALEALGTVRLRAGYIEVLATVSGADPDEVVDALRPAIRDDA